MKTKLNYTDLLNSIRSLGFAGLAVIGDVHSMYESLVAAVAYAKAHNLFIVFLGDLIDYGHNPVGVIDLVYDLVLNEQAIVIMGNHEHKYMRILLALANAEAAGLPRKRENIKVRFTHGTENTFNVIESLPVDDRINWQMKFSTIYDVSSNYFWIGDLVVTHGAYHHTMSENMGICTLSGKAEKFALFGQTDGNSVDDTDRYQKWLLRFGMFTANHRVVSMNDLFSYDNTEKKVVMSDMGDFPIRIYDWLDTVPAGKIVMVGHDFDRMVEGKPFDYTNKDGGRVVFVDTGSGKGGKLSLVPVSFDMNVGTVVQF